MSKLKKIDKDKLKDLIVFVLCVCLFILVVKLFGLITEYNNLIDSYINLTQGCFFP